MESTGAVFSVPDGVAVRSTKPERETSRRAPPQGRLITGATVLAVVVALIGWWNRDESNWGADEGVGYALGVIGLSCMTALLLYVVRKRARVLRGAGRISTWFQIHMILGLFGPVAILYHCNFQFGSLNSNVALVCSLVVSASGVVGRVIYTRIHHGLSDRRSTLDDVREEVARARDGAEKEQLLPELWAQLDEFEAQVSRPKRNPLDAAWSYLLLGHRGRRASGRAIRSLRRAAVSHPEIAARRHELRSSAKHFIAAVRRTETFGVYERVFALWHVFHLPLALLLYVSAAVHVVAVNMY
jgi:hypothetical protein